MNETMNILNNLDKHKDILKTWFCYHWRNDGVNSKNFKLGII